MQSKSNHFKLTENKYVEINQTNHLEKQQIIKILKSPRLSKLITDVLIKYETSYAIIEINNDLDCHGAFDPKSKIPKILLNPKTGISESNIAHEFIHSIQIRNNFSTSPSLCRDKRNNVIRELNSNILHISLTTEMKERGFSIEEYLRPTLQSMKRVLMDRDINSETNLTFLRSHYEASIFLRLHYEADFLNQTERNEIENIIKEKSPIAMSICYNLIEIIDKYNTQTPMGSIQALYYCTKYLNDLNMSAEYSDYKPSPYSEYLIHWKAKYLFLK